MDLFTHVILGAAVGGFVASKKLGNKAIWWGAACSIIPDFDLFFAPWFETTEKLFIHRGLSHSIFFFLFLAPLLAILLHKFNKKIEYSLAQWTRFIFFILVSHSFIDVFSVYGTGIFEPFISKRYAISSLSIVDIFYTIPLFVTVLIALKVKQNRHKSIISWFGIFISLLYLSFTVLNKLYIQSEFEKKLVSKDIKFSRTEIFPVPGSNFLWNCVAQDRDGFWMCYESNFSTHNFELELYMRNDYYTFDFDDDMRFQNLQRFSRGFYIVEKNEAGELLFRDLRFGRFGLSSKAPFVFSFKIIQSQGKIQTIESIYPSFSRFFLHEKSR
jgi:inner membrane protein